MAHLSPYTSPLVGEGDHEPGTDRWIAINGEMVEGFLAFPPLKPPGA